MLRYSIHDAFCGCRRSQLPLPRVDPGVLRGGWTDTLSFVREFLRGDNVAVFDMRLMVVGASMVCLIL